MIANIISYIERQQTAGYGKRAVEWLEFFGRVMGDVVGTFAWMVSPVGISLELIAVLQANAARQDLVEPTIFVIRQTFVAAGIGFGVLIGIIPALLLAFLEEGVLASLRHQYTNSDVTTSYDLLFSFNHKLWAAYLYDYFKEIGLLLGLLMLLSSASLGFFATAALYVASSWVIAGLGCAFACILGFEPSRNFLISSLENHNQTIQINATTLAPLLFSNTPPPLSFPQQQDSVHVYTTLDQGFERCKVM